MSKDLYLNTTPTTAGIKPIFWFVPVKDVATQVGATVTLKAGKQWSTFKSIKYAAEVSIVQGGPKLFAIGLRAAIAHDSPGLQTVMQNYTGADGFLVIYEDLNNYRWLIGTLTQPLKLNNTGKTGRVPGGAVGLGFAFTGNVTGVAKYEYTDGVDASDPVAPPNAAGVTIQSGTFSDFAASGSIYQLPTDWESLVEMFGRGYNYPQPTGQTTVYRTGDDADIEATIFAPIRVANSLKVQNSLVDFTTLGNKNSFGNLARFTSDIGGYESGASIQSSIGIYFDKDGTPSSYSTEFAKKVMIDHYTGLMWWCLHDYNGSKTFDESIDYALASNEEGYSGWFLPSVIQLQGLLHYEDKTASEYMLAYPLIENNTYSWAYGDGKLILGTTGQSSPDNVMYFRPTTDSFGTSLKTIQAFDPTLCRKHF